MSLKFNNYVITLNKDLSNLYQLLLPMFISRLLPNTILVFTVVYPQSIILLLSQNNFSTKQLTVAIPSDHTQPGSLHCTCCQQCWVQWMESEPNSASTHRPQGHTVRRL